MNIKAIKMNKRGAGLVGGIISGAIGIIILVVIGFVIISTLLTSDLLDSGSEEENISLALRDNLSSGVTAVGNKIPTILGISAVVLLFGVLVLLVARSKAMTGGGGSL